MVISTRRMSKRTLEPVDQWLAKEGYFRKPTPRDPTCLFRAISEQVYHTQHYHLRVREECTHFMKQKRNLFMSNFVTESYDYYLNEMQCFTSWGGPIEIDAMSMLYQRDIIVFVGEKQICETFSKDYKTNDILLCHTEPKQYEPVYPMAFVQSAAYCQSIVYEVVYKYMYQMPNIKTVADKMLHNRNTTIRHDRFFQRGNLDIREQLIEDLYKKVKHEHSDSSDEVQSDWRGGAPPIPYKVAKALAPDYYRNIELDIWHELKREVKSAGWNRYNSNELQVGGKCLIEININDLEQCDRNNNKRLVANSLDRGVSESNSKIEHQKGPLKGPIWLQGYIQELNRDGGPVLVFIKDLGEKKFVPYDALKPLPVMRKNKQKNWITANRNQIVNSDSSRRWKKSYNSFSRKKKDTINVIHGTSNANKNILTNNDSDNNNNNVDCDNINDINKSRTDEQNDELATIDQCQTENQSVEGYCNRATNEEANNLPAIVAPQSTLPNSASQKVEEQHKKAVFRKTNNTARNKTERSNNPRNGFQNSCSKLKALDENYCSPCNSNQQINMVGNPNVSYVVADNGSTYPVYQYVPGNFGEHNQMDHTLATNFLYNIHPQHLEDSFRSLPPPYYGPMMYGPGHHGVQPSGNAHMNNVPCTQDEMEHFINGMQNCSLTYSEGASANDETSNTSHWSMNNGAQNIGQLKQGSKNLSGKDSSYQVAQKGKQTAIAKGTGNRARNRQQKDRGSMYSMQQQHSAAQHYGGTSMNTYDTRRNDPHVVQHNPSWDPMLHQIAPNTSSNAYASPQYAPPPSVFSSPMPYHEMSSHYTTNESILGNPSPYYPPGNGSYVPVPSYLPPQHIDAAENATVSSYPQHLYSPPESSYPQSHSQAVGQPMLYSQPMVYPQPMQYHALLAPPHVQEQWNLPILGPQPYVQCAASAPVQPQVSAEPSSNGQCITTPKGSL